MRNSRHGNFGVSGANSNFGSQTRKGNHYQQELQNESEGEAGDARIYADRANGTRPFGKNPSFNSGHVKQNTLQNYQE